MTHASAPPSAPHAAARRRVRALDGLVTLLVGASLAGLVAMLAPPVLRATGVGAAPRARLDGRLTGPHTVPAARPGRGFLTTEPGESDDDDTDPLDPPELRPGWAPGKPMPRRQRDDDAAPRAESGSERTKVAFARGAIDLRQEPRDGATVVGRVPAEATLIVMKDSGDWSLVVHSGDDGIAMGWAPKGRLALR